MRETAAFLKWLLSENFVFMGVDAGEPLGIQALGVVITIVWIGVVSAIGFLVAKLVFGLRVSEEAEREGLDITTHGESAYES